jgi:hypothetical protein
LLLRTLVRHVILLAKSLRGSYGKICSTEEPPIDENKVAPLGHNS